MGSLLALGVSIGLAYMIAKFIVDAIRGKYRC
jgi:hypothetical protein